jgi:hypothetical protein
MSDSAAGWLLLSTIAQPRRDGVIRRLNAEASDDRKFCFSDMAARVQATQQSGHAIGVAGFGSIADTCAVLLPNQPANRPIALGFVYEPSSRVDPEALAGLLKNAVARCAEQPEHSAIVVPFSSAA